MSDFISFVGGFIFGAMFTLLITSWSLAETGYDLHRRPSQTIIVEALYGDTWKTTDVTLPNADAFRLRIKDK